MFRIVSWYTFCATFDEMIFLGIVGVGGIIEWSSWVRSSNSLCAKNGFDNSTLSKMNVGAPLSLYSGILGSGDGSGAGGKFLNVRRNV